MTTHHSTNGEILAMQKRIEELEAGLRKAVDTASWIDDIANSESFGEGGDDNETRFFKIRENCKDICNLLPSES